MKLFITLLSIIVSLNCFGWGQTGHRVVGQIAQNHLSSKAQKAIQEIMGRESLAYASTWMDEIKSDDHYDHTHVWHWVTIPDGGNLKKIDEDQQELYYKLANLNLSDTLIIQILKDHTKEAILSALGALEYTNKKEGVRNPAALLKSALSEGWKAPSNEVIESQKEPSINLAHEEEIQNLKWREIRKRFYNTYGVSLFNSWIKDVVVEEDDRVLYLVSPSKFNSEWIKNNYFKFFEKAWKESYPDLIRIEFKNK